MCGEHLVETWHCLNIEKVLGPPVVDEVVMGEGEKKES